MSINIKELAYNEIDSYSVDLFDLSKFLFTNPETAYEEIKAHDYICNFLRLKGFKVEGNFLHFTGFRATYETKSNPHFAILVEYDALPKIGHACGHNIIAQSSIATALGLKAAMDKGLQCKLSVLGTPAEEGGGGKIKFITEGIFKDVDASIMSHSFNKNVLDSPSLAIIGLTVTFTGKEAHASICPWEGRNALDAAVLAYQSISCLRQQMPVDNRIHGIITKGGDAPNIIPHLTEMQYYVRAPNSKLLKEFLLRVYECFNGAAIITKCEVDIQESCPLYEELINNKTLLNIFEQNASALGISFETIANSFRISSDVGNVSHCCPTIQPMFSLGCSSNLHTKEFAVDAGTITAQKSGIIQGKAMAGTLIDIAMDKDYNLLRNMKQEFHNQISTLS